MGDDSDEEWFFNSIKRYKELIMYDSGDPIHQVELCDKETICVLMERKGNKKPLSVLTLPSKMTYCSSTEIQQSSDLKIKSGIFPPSPPCRILAVYEKDRLLTTLSNTSGLMVYKLKASDAEQISYDNTLNTPLIDPEMVLIDSSTVVLTKDTSQKSLFIDLNSGEEIRSCIVKDGSSNILIPVCIKMNIVAFTETFAGRTHLFDWRSNEFIGTIKGIEDYRSTPSTNYSYLHKTNPSNNIYFLSDSGLFTAFDLRNFQKPVMIHKIEVSSSNKQPRVKFSPERLNVVSVSGFDGNVYIFDISRNMTEIFRHDGHSRTEFCEKNTLITDHIWYSDEYLISVALNNSINCWIPSIDS